jgi:hypothetical protein
LCSKNILGLVRKNSNLYTTEGGTLPQL